MKSRRTMPILRQTGRNLRRQFHQVPASFPNSVKEANMHYKTIILELLKQHRAIYNQLRSTRMLLPTMERFAGELKTSHEVWKECLSRARPGSDPSQIASAALECPLKELWDSLDS